MRKFIFATIVLCAMGLFMSGPSYAAEQPIVIGAPLSTAFLYGWDAERGIKLAADEINAAGGVKVGAVNRPFKVEVIDTRDLEPGVPVSEALLGLEKLILEKKADFIIGGPVRSEAALAAMDILNRYKKVSIVTTGVLTPAYHKKVEDNYGKYKYCFRNTSHVGVMMGEFVTLLEDLRKSYGFDKAAIMVQDVAACPQGWRSDAEGPDRQGLDRARPEDLSHRDHRLFHGALRCGQERLPDTLSLDGHAGEHDPSQTMG